MLLERVWEDLSKERARKSALRLHPVEMMPPMIPQQYGYPNQTWTRIVSGNILIWTAEISWAPPLEKEVQLTKECKVRESSLEEFSKWLSNIKCSALKLHTHTQSHQVGSIYLCIYTYR